MNDEIELKLALSPEDQRRLRRHPLVRSLAFARATTKPLVSLYYDTPDFALRDRGMALRVRRIGARRVQTLKAIADGGECSAKHYREFEAELPDDTPDLTLIDDETILAGFAADGIAERLQPIFTTSFQRVAVPMRFADSEVELALDLGEIFLGPPEESGGSSEAGETAAPDPAGEAATAADDDSRPLDRREPICEAEFELLSGRPARLYELALALGERIGFQIERRTKAARGYVLAEAAHPDASWPRPAKKAPEVALEAAMPARAAFEIAVRACLAQIAANEPVVLAGADREGVHQLRVGVRRLRALVGAFKPLLTPDAVAYLREDLRWLQQALGAAREWDVFLEETLRPLRARMNGLEGLEALDEAAHRLRDAAYESARVALLESRYVRLLLRLDLWLEDGGWLREGEAGKPAPGDAPIAAFAAAVLDKRDKRLRKLSRRHARLAEDEMHHIRLLAKKKRYCLEALGSLYPGKAVKAALASLKSIQDSLGRFNDAVVGRRLLDELEAALDAEAFAPLAGAAAAVRGWQAATMEQDIAAFRAVWKDYEAGKRFWRG